MTTTTNTERGHDPDTRLSERDMLNLLAARYTAVREYTIADRWVRAEHVASSLGATRNRVVDFIAADRYPAGDRCGLALHGHEVKVTRADWLRELRDPTKAAPFLSYMHHWWIVVASPHIVKPGELPDGYGLMSATTTGTRLRALVPAPRRDAAAAPTELVISLMAAAARTAHRDPHHRDAPTVRKANAVPRTWLCGFCGHHAPCPVHQPRAVRAETHEDDMPAPRSGV